MKKSRRGTGKNKLKPVRPAMSWPWIDARPKPVPEVRNEIELDGRSYQLYWGDIHGHSNLSADSWYHSPDGYYRYGRKVAKLDFCALTDHDAPLSLARYPERWKKSVESTERNYEPGRFATLIAFEWTSGTPEGSMLPRLKRRDRYAYLKDPAHFGHRNIYFPGDEVPDHVFSHDDPRYDTPEKLWRAMEPYGAISIPHHTLGGPVCPFIWEHFNEEMEPVVEIYSTHGNSECEGCVHEIYNPYRNGRHSVRASLEQGRHFGFIASSDTHMGLAGNCTRPDFNISFSQWYFRGRTRPPGPGVAAAYLEELSREAVFEALRARRVYAVTGSRIVMDVRADGHFMGSRFSAVGPVAVSIRVKGMLPIHTIEVLKNGKTVEKFFEPGKDADIEYVDERRERAEDYIYVRVLQKDAHMAWSSPIWISK